MGEQGSGRVSRWVSHNPVRAAAIALIALQLAMRLEIASRGYLAFDDFTFASRAAGSHLSSAFLLRLSNNHLMPGGLLVTWLVTRATASPTGRSSYC
jgi:cytochrome b